MLSAGGGSSGTTANGTVAVALCHRRPRDKRHGLAMQARLIRCMHALPDPQSWDPGSRESGRAALLLGLLPSRLRTRCGAGRPQEPPCWNQRTRGATGMAGGAAGFAHGARGSRPAPRDAHAGAGWVHVGGQRLPCCGEEEEGADAAPGAVLTAPGGSGAARGGGGAAPWHAGHLRRSGGRRLGGGGGAGAGGGSAQRPQSRAASGQGTAGPLPTSRIAKPAGPKPCPGASRPGAETKRGQGRRAGICGRRKGLESRAGSGARGPAGLGGCGVRGRCGSGRDGAGRRRKREKHKTSVTGG